MVPSKKIIAEGRAVPLWFVSLLAVLVLSTVAYVSLTTISPGDVLIEVREHRVEASKARDSLKLKIDGLEEKIVPIEDIVEIINENTDFPWLKERGEWIEWRGQVEDRTTTILTKIDGIEDTLKQNTATAGHGHEAAEETGEEN